MKHVIGRSSRIRSSSPKMYTLSIFLCLLLHGAATVSNLTNVDSGLTEIPIITNVNLTDIRIEQNHIKEITKNNFKGMRLLRSLGLYYNRIAIVHNAAFRDLVSLEMLDLSMNPLKHLNRTLFANLRNLRYLYLTGLGLNEFPNIGPATGTLRFLDISYNAIRAIPRGYFSNMTSLSTLSIASNRIRSLLYPDLRGLRDLQLLDVSYNSLSHFNSSVFSGLARLNDLDMSACSISEFPCIALYTESTVGELDIKAHRNSIHNFTEECIEHMLKFETLKIYVDNNDLMAVNMFEPLIPSLVDISISGNGFNTFMKAEDNYTWILKKLSLSRSNYSSCPNFPKRMRNSTVHLDLGKNGMECIDTEHLFGFDSLKVLKLYGNKLESFPVYGCASNTSSDQATLALPSLQELGLGDNDIPQTPNLTLMSKLRKLYMNHNKLTKVDATMLAGLSRLHTIEMNNNDIDEFPNFGPIGSTNGIRILRLSKNKIEKVAWSLLQLIPNLEKLSLGNNSIASFIGECTSTTSCTGRPIGTIDFLELGKNILDKFQDYLVLKMEHLKYLGLANNRLTTFKNMSFRYPSSREIVVKLYGNPLHCDQKLCWLKDKLKGKTDTMGLLPDT